MANYLAERYNVDLSRYNDVEIPRGWFEEWERKIDEAEKKLEAGLEPDSTYEIPRHDVVLESGLIIPRDWFTHYQPKVESKSSPVAKKPFTQGTEEQKTVEKESEQMTTPNQIEKLLQKLRILKTEGNLPPGSLDPDKPVSHIRVLNGTRLLGQDNRIFDLTGREIPQEE